MNLKFVLASIFYTYKYLIYKRLLLSQLNIAYLQVKFYINTEPEILVFLLEKKRAFFFPPSASGTQIIRYVSEIPGRS